MTIEEQLLEASAALSGLTAERDDLRATVEKLTVGAAAELEQLKVEASVKDASLASLTEVVKTIEAEAAALKAAALEAEATKVSASKEAAKIAASVGVTPVALPQGDGLPPRPSTTTSLSWPCLSGPKNATPTLRPIALRSSRPLSNFPQPYSILTHG